MIYIDPPYNTGNDFVYEDDFAESADEYMDCSGDYDEEGNRLVKNLDSNGRFHTDWLNMIYPRLKMAKDLLKDNGVIIIMYACSDKQQFARDLLTPIIENETSKRETIHNLTTEQMTNSIKTVLEEIGDTLIAEGHDVSYA